MNQIFKATKLCYSVLLLTLIMSGSAIGADSADNPESVSGNSSGKIYGKVIETLDSGSYTYIHVDSGEEKYWVASASVTLEAGSMVSFGTDMPMTNFTSKSLDRTFDIIYFVSQITTDQAGAHDAKADQNSVTGNADSVNVDNIEKAANGISINEVLTEKQKFVGETVLIRGMVVKYTPKVMGKNWIHIRDSSSPRDLTVTTSDTVNKGDIILVSGKLQLDRDFGHGYIYEVLLEDSTVTIE